MDTSSLDVEVEIIEPSQLSIIATPGSIAQNFAGVKSYVLKVIDSYDRISLADCDIKTMKTARASLNSLVKLINDQRINAERVYMAPFDVVKVEINELLLTIKSAASRIDVQVKEAEEWSRNDRLNTYRSFYEDFAPLLAPVVPFDLILDNKWLNRTYSGDPKEKITEIVSKIAADWQLLKDLNLEHFEQAEIVFFRTLDLSQAIAENNRVKGEKVRIETMKADTKTFAASTEQLKEAAEISRLPEPVYGASQEQYAIRVICSIAEAQKFAESIREQGYTVTLAKDS